MHLGGMAGEVEVETKQHRSGICHLGVGSFINTPPRHFRGPRVAASASAESVWQACFLHDLFP